MPTPVTAAALVSRTGFLLRRRRSYRVLTLPAMAVVAAVIVFPWMFTVYMSAFDWKIGEAAHFVGLSNYTGLAKNQRFLESIVHTFYFTLLAVIFPLVLGTAAALIFHREFRGRGFLRAIFTMPMMATPVAVALARDQAGAAPAQGPIRPFRSCRGPAGTPPWPCAVRSRDRRR